MSSDDTLAWLIEWFAARCDGEWEHGQGVSIETIDNPGWMVKIELKDTRLEKVTFETTEHNYSSDVSWYRCWVERGVFRAACGSRDLVSVLEIFRRWATENSA
ncbi:MAG: immunity 53 family protein [Alphaproteobacteria bacterium]|nr:immunity 53 family protein [Alphaproteobacteria bacterium]